MLRLSSLFAALAALAALTLVPGASSARMAGTPLTLDSQHFRVHYDGDATQPDYVSQAQAGDVLGWAEQAYSFYSGLGWGPPVDDGDGKLDITIDALTPPEIAVGTIDTPSSGPSSGRFELDSKTGLSFHTVAHEVFNLFEWSIDSANDPWLDQGAAEWAAFAADSFSGVTASDFGEPERTLDCVGDQCGFASGASADELAYNRSGNPGWSFFEYLAERYGNSFIRTIFEQASSNGSGSPSTQAVDDALAGKGSSLAAQFNGWITARLSGNFSLKAIQGLLPQVFASTATGAIAGAIPTQIVNVDHLAARYLAFVPGDGTTSNLCHAGTLALSVTIPSGVSSTPAVYVKGGQTQLLSVSGQTASITIPWSDCTGAATAYLSLPNASDGTTANGTEFIVKGTLTIDPNTIATAANPPDPVSMPGVVIAAPADPIPPTIDVWGPQVIHVSSTSRVVRLIVLSDTDGTVEGSLGSYALGTVAIRTGGNDVRFVLPASAARRTAAVGQMITLQPLASTGYAGVAVTRPLAIDFPKLKPKLKAKPHKGKPKHALKPVHHRADHKG